MENRWKYRLIGFATLLLILVVVAPFVITDKSSHKAESISLLPSDYAQSSTLPDNSPLSVPDIPPTISNNGSETLSHAMTNESATGNSAGSVSDPQPVSITPPPDGKIYTIQLVALKNRQKIDELVALLSLNGYDVSIEPKNPAKDQLIRLFVGPYSSKAQAEMVIIDLNNLTKLKGFLIGK